MFVSAKVWHDLQTKVFQASINVWHRGTVILKSLDRSCDYTLKMRLQSRDQDNVCFYL